MCNHQKYYLLQLIFSFKLLNEEYTSNNYIFEKEIHEIFVVLRLAKVGVSQIVVLFQLTKLKLLKVSMRITKKIKEV